MTSEVHSIQGDSLLVGKIEVARLTGISTRSLDRLVSCGKFLSPVRLGGRVLWNRRALDEWIASLSCDAIPGQGGRRNV